jgi:hypothetical protein
MDQPVVIVWFPPRPQVSDVIRLRSRLDRLMLVGDWLVVLPITLFTYRQSIHGGCCHERQARRLAYRILITSETDG